MDNFALIAAAFLAGMVDAVGTTKFASIFGTASAAVRYSRQIEVPWRAALPAAATAFAAAYFGAMCVALFPRELLRPLVLALLIVVAVYTLMRKDFGSVDQYRRHGAADMALALLMGAAIGFYDGFFGPGTGSFLMFLFIRFFGLDFVRSSCAAKIVNVATNAAALWYFIPHGDIIWAIALLMALFNVAGSLTGSWLALRHGSGFVRKVFLAVVGTLILKFGYDTLAVGGVA
jgi:uncharacterized membrane protein YfcA